MRVKITDPVISNGKPAFPGDIVDVSDGDGLMLTRIGRAVEIDGVDDPGPGLEQSMIATAVPGGARPGRKAPTSRRAGKAKH